MASTEHKSAAEIEHEAELQRRRVSETIDELQARLSPGQIVDQVIGYAGNGAGDFAQNMGRAIRDNPLPVALMGASLIWLMSGRSANGHPGAARNAGYDPYATSFGRRDGAMAAAGDVMSDAGDRLHDAGASIGEAARRAGDAASGMAAQAGSAVQQAGDAVGHGMEQARHGLDQARHAVHDGMAQAQGSVSGLGTEVSHQMDQIGRRARGMQEEMTSLFREQPLIAAALAFAAGAALGAAVPVSRKEDEVMGETADRLKADLQQAAEPLLEKGREAVDEAVQQGKALVEETTEEARAALAQAQDDLGDSYDRLKESASETASEAVRHLDEASRKAADEIKAKAARTLDSGKSSDEQAAADRGAPTPKSRSNTGQSAYGNGGTTH